MSSKILDNDFVQSFHGDRELRPKEVPKKTITTSSSVRK
jgi:hypothetical protein